MLLYHEMEKFLQLAYVSRSKYYLLLEHLSTGIGKHNGRGLTNSYFICSVTMVFNGMMYQLTSL